MVSFELGKDIEKDVFSSCHERGTKKKKKKFWVPIRSQTSDLRIRRSGARKFTISLIYINKHYALNIADLSSNMSYECRNRLRSPWSLCCSVARVSERGIQGSEVRFLIGTQNFFCVPRSWQEEKTPFAINYSVIQLSEHPFHLTIVGKIFINVSKLFLY